MNASIALYINDVSKTYKQLKAVNHLSFSVEKSHCFGILGPNGAGKTTMMKIIYGKNKKDPDHGAINIFGLDPEKDSLSIKYISGIVPQSDNLDMELSVIQNLIVYSKFYGLRKKEAIGRIEELLSFMELSEKRNQRIRHLSGGMQRRLVIARALLNNPKLLILDEPTTGLDPQVRHVIWDKLRMLKKQGVTLLLTTHYMEEAFQLCDHLMMMNKGEKIIEGNPIQLIRDNIESYVLELFSSVESLPEDIPDPIRIERSSHRTFLYSQLLDALSEIAKDINARDYYLRQSNLEDLFLKMTGRELND